jgi:protein-S-isoprenylcysteine O-methyltransferase Ste14
MHLLDQRALGFVMLLLLSTLVITKHLATGSILRDKPSGGSLRLWVTHTFNLFFLLIVNPTAAMLLIARHGDACDPTRIIVNVPWLLMSLEIAGMVLYGGGHLLMGWALVRLGRNYQAGGNPPRGADEMVVVGPYRVVRHPMYAAALAISLGLACMIQSLAFFSVFCIYLALITLLIPAEEEGLRRAYGEQYTAYQQKVKRIAPLLY